MKAVIVEKGRLILDIPLHFRRIIKVIRLKPFDTSSETGRAQERHRRIALTALASSAAKAITIATGLITVPLTLNYLGDERYGLWMTISSVIAMMVFADFGIGLGLMNAVAEAYGKDDKDAIKRHVANALLILSVIAIIILVSFFISYPFIDWGGFFNVKSNLAMKESGPALAILVICFALGVPAGIVQRVQMGLQQGFASSIWQAGGSVLGLLLTLLVISLEGGLPWLAIGLGGAPVIISVLNGFVFFSVQSRDLAPDLLRISRPGMVRILQGGLLFFMLQIGVSIAYASDNIIIAKILGASSVAQYSVVSKMFDGVLMVIGLAFVPLWPAYGEAKARGDWLWIKKTLARSMFATFFFAATAAILLVGCHKTLLQLWVGTKHVFPFALVAWYALWMVLKGLGGTYSYFLNGMNVMRLQLVVATVFMTISITLKIFLVYKIGLIGVPVALAFSYITTVVIPYALTTNNIIKST
jgi:O-antigen/teichoic acid export membrane protein